MNEDDKDLITIQNIQKMFNLYSTFVDNFLKFRSEPTGSVFLKVESIQVTFLYA